MVRSTLAGRAAVIAVAAATIGLSRPASATEKKTITGTELLTGDATGNVLYDELTVAKGAVLLVRPYDGAKGLGQLRIHANLITVAEGGTISAVGAGFRGREGMDGEAASMSNGGGTMATTVGWPGGGGAYAGDGAPGLIALCTSVASLGGKSFFASMDALGLGSAGGAANVKGAPATRGGNGGGLIVLEAAKVVIDGTVDVSGGTALPLGGVAPGGGSGGAIFIHTAALSGTGLLRARGGDAPHGAGDLGGSIDPNNGGGGSGGVIRILGPQRPASLAIDLGGGQSGACGAGHDGADDSKVMANGCVDADGDKSISEACGGTDCNDGDALVSPTGTEICNGVDDNCDGKIDEGEALCSIGSACVKGACTSIADGGPPSDGGTDPGARPDHLGLEGGCSLGGPFLGAPSLGGAAGPGLGAGLGLAFLASQRRRRRRNGKAG